MASQSFGQYLRNSIELECAVCNRRVDELHSEFDVCTRVTKYLVRCHGQEQRVDLPDEWLMSGRVTVGRAFEAKQIALDLQQITEG